MKNIFFICLFFPFFLYGQKKGKEQYVFTLNSGIVIDANVEDWTGLLYKENSDLWSFGMAVDENYLFATAIVKDSQLISEAIRNGILLNISYSDKKKDGARLLFPRFNMEKLESTLDEDREGVKFSNLELLQSAKGYYVAGFSKVVDGLLSFENQYGIQAKCSIDTLGRLIYEAKVPLRLINFKTDKIAVELGINTYNSQLKKAIANRSGSDTRGYSVYSRGLMSSSSIKDPYGEETSVWFTGIIK